MFTKAQLLCLKVRQELCAFWSTLADELPKKLAGTKVPPVQVTVLSLYDFKFKNSLVMLELGSFFDNGWTMMEYLGVTQKHFTYFTRKFLTFFTSLQPTSDVFTGFTATSFGCRKQLTSLVSAYFNFVGRQKFPAADTCFIYNYLYNSLLIF